MSGTNDCSIYDRCSAPLCPMNSESMRSGAWKADEPICSSRAYCTMTMVQIQYKIRKKSKDTDTIYTSDMLNRNIMVTKAITGIDPDVLHEDFEGKVKKFIEKRPEMSDEFRQARRDRIAKTRACKG